MKAPKEIRRWMNRMRAKRGKGNGVVSGALLDNPKMERIIKRTMERYPETLARLAEYEREARSSK